MSILNSKKIVYDGDSICEGRYKGQAANGGAYAKIIADATGCTYVNNAIGGGTLCSQVNRGETPWGGKYHSVVDCLDKLPKDGDLYCFEGGINDYWQNFDIGDVDPFDYDGELDTDTVCGAMEYIFRYALKEFVGKPICFVITHKISDTFFTANAHGRTFSDYHPKMVAVCKKYSIPYYDAFSESGLNGWNEVQNNAFLTAGSNCTPIKGDGCHPNEAAYRRYYVPQLISLFERIMPR